MPPRLHLGSKRNLLIPTKASPCVEPQLASRRDGTTSSGMVLSAAGSVVLMLPKRKLPSSASERLRGSVKILPEGLNRHRRSYQNIGGAAPHCT